MGYLRLYDYFSNIQQPVFNQVLQSNDSLRVVKEAVSQALITSYITQKFDVSKEFLDTKVFAVGTTYYANSLVELSGYPAYVNATTYTGVGTDFVINASKAYVLKTSGATGAFDASKWTLLGSVYDLFYITLPYTEFNIYGIYKVGDIRYWKNKVYQCLSPTVIPDHIEQLQAGTYANLPLNNVFPDDPINGLKNWGAGVTYSLSGLIPNGVAPAAWAAGPYVAGDRVTLNGQIWKALVNNSVKPGLDITNWQPEGWTFGDNRNAQLVECMVWITIAKLAPLISPRNIPVFWDTKYKEFITWLQMCADGHVTLDAPLIQPSQGSKIRFGSQIKRRNDW